MVDPQKNNIHKIINVYLVSIYQLSIFAYLKDSTVNIHCKSPQDRYHSDAYSCSIWGSTHPRFQATELLQDEQRKEKRKTPKAKARFPKRRFEG